MGLRDQLNILDSRISAMELNSTTGPAIYATPTAVAMTGTSHLRHVHTHPYPIREVES